MLPAVEPLLRILKSYHVHIIVISTEYRSLDRIIKEVDQKLIRGCSYHDIHPLTNIHSTQRLVHTVMKNVNFAPTTTDQRLFEQLEEFTTGSPPIVEITSQILLTKYNQGHEGAAQAISNVLELNTNQDTPHPAQNTTTDEARTPPSTDSVWGTNSIYDSWDAITVLIETCKLSPLERWLFNCITVFGGQPVPLQLVTEMSSKIAKSGQKVHLASTLYDKLFKCKLMKPYPLPIVVCPSDKEKACETEFVYVPQYLAECIWSNLDETDKIAVLAVIYSSVPLLHELNATSNELAQVLHSLFLNIFDQNYTLVGKECYQECLSIIVNQ